ncbi:hypothetical protein SPRG_13107 [Saprolegnia parasitica CBS 223.65]|uniref:Uncharacterized protein n=1 Tax=Saprolegnia parasitica (strain CBS 223.65) TaxID=695850 RepID=A0A067BYJ7_SAPPC|nr:hypothetical protein SPRG_13107 [Saprolegnia parasitica CBS 223.65]KDO21925.1 hypothetical protein SPRG_13107 [Saprolegnia parasitica CBS 223.65]|eukprot:XP_012207367.1 hypothetical protein SPRG_13107 [Saprolegnia parasitica CBS 223.65]
MGAQRAFIEAVASGDATVVANLLRDGADANALDDHPMLAVAALHGHTSVVAALLEAKADVDAMTPVLQH